MSVLLWLLFTILVSSPMITFWVYYLRRRGARRNMLEQSLLSLGLDTVYMQIRHGEKHDQWLGKHRPDQIAEFQATFRRDFRSGTRWTDYLWPVTLFTLLSGVGWFLTLAMMHPSFTTAEGAASFLPKTFAYGLTGAYLASLLTIFDEYRRYNLSPGTYYVQSYRLLFASTAAYLFGPIFTEAYTPLAAFGIGLLPTALTWESVVNRTSRVVGAVKEESEPGFELAQIQGLEQRSVRQRLIDINILTVQALATTDPIFLLFETTLPLRTIVDLIDKAILYLYLGETVKELRQRGINGVIELVTLIGLQEGTRSALTTKDFFKKIDIDQLVNDLATAAKQTPNEFRAFVYNLYHDPLVQFIWDIWSRYLKPKFGAIDEFKQVPEILARPEVDLREGVRHEAHDGNGLNTP